MARPKLKNAKSRRNVLVIGALLSSLTLTSVLLLILAPSPLVPEPRSLLVAESNPNLDEIFDTSTPISSRRWQSIFVHHSKTRRGDGHIGDHFLITTAADGADGGIRIDQTWTNQQPAVASANLGSNCISICIVGDFDQSTPSAMQVRCAQQLIQTLQRRLRIPGKNVIAFDRPNSPAGLGHGFPAASLRDALLP